MIYFILASPAGEIFLRFCSFVQRLGEAKQGANRLKLVLNDGELEERWSTAAPQEKKVREHRQPGEEGSARPRIMLTIYITPGSEIRRPVFRRWRNANEGVRRELGNFFSRHVLVHRSGGPSNNIFCCMFNDSIFARRQYPHPCAAPLLQPR